MVSITNIDQIAEFAEAYATNVEIEDQENMREIIKKQGKKMYNQAVECPAIILFMTDNALISLEDVDKYLIDVSWIEWPDVIRRLIEYKRNPPKIQKEAKDEKLIKRQDNPRNNWTTEKTADGTLILKSFKGTGTKVFIPSVIGKSHVSKVGETALSPCKYRITDEQIEVREKIKEVVIEEGIKSIERSAFYDCKNIVSVALPETLETIGANAFKGCTSLTSINIPESINTIGENAFGQVAVKKVIWPRNAIISKAVFSYSKVTEIEITYGTIAIEDFAFHGCTELKTITIPDSVKEIGAGAFEDCEQLKEVHIPKGIKSIGIKTFAGCKSLEILYIPSSVKEIDEGNQKKGRDNKLLPFRDCNNVVIYTPSGSFAEGYATNHGIPVINTEE